MTTLAERFWSKVNFNGPVPDYRPDLGPCHLWTASTNAGYGQITVSGKTVKAHHVAWLLAHGSLPDNIGLKDGQVTYDHLCRVKSCVNTVHGDWVSLRVNYFRGDGGIRRLHCPHGHRLTLDNTHLVGKYQGRGCRACASEYEKGKRTNCPEGHEYNAGNTVLDKNGRRVCLPCARVRQMEMQAIKPPVTHCPRGHEYSEDNTYTRARKDGTLRRNCRACAAENQRRYRKDGRYPYQH